MKVYVCINGDKVELVASMRLAGVICGCSGSLISKSMKFDRCTIGNWLIVVRDVSPVVRNKYGSIKSILSKKSY